MLGCRLNQSEIDAMARQFGQQGYEIVQDAGDADLFVVNTCAVTHEAARASRHLMRDLHRANADAPIIATGCYAQIAPAQIATLPGVAEVVDNAGKDALVARVTGQELPPYDAEPISRGEAFPGASGRTRAFIKVQDGCDNACTFCVTTVARGPGRSRSAQAIVAEIRQLHALGYQEAVLTGVHLGSYGHDQGVHHGLADLVGAILNETDIPRLRLSSLEPWDLAPDFFDLWADSRLCPHLHLPLQSGCDATLKRMRRHTTQADFRALIEAARARIPDLSLTTDVIVGFPGETDAEFAEGEAFIAAMDFAGLHVFRYSSRPETPAARMRGQVADSVKRARSQRLQEIGAAGAWRFGTGQCGRIRPVLWEQIGGATQDGFMNVGYTDNYIRVRAVDAAALTNRITLARLDHYVDDYALATVVPGEEAEGSDEHG